MKKHFKYFLLLFVCFLNIGTAKTFNTSASENLHNHIAQLIDEIVNGHYAKVTSHAYADSPVLTIAHKKIINVVAAENFYGNVAYLIAGDYANVKSIITNVHADPHLFTTSTKTAMIVQNADVIIFNGADYDPWIKPFINVKNNKVTTVDVSSLVNAQSGDNPHIWYQPQTFVMLAKKLTEIFSAIAPKHEKTFRLNLKTFLQRYQSIDTLIHSIKSKYQGTKVTATEPIFGYMAEALGLVMMGQKFQWVMMNDAEPTPKMLIHYQRLLTDKQVNVLFHNKQVQGNTSDALLKLAKAHHIPIVGITESMPKGNNVITWLKTILEETKKALALADQNNKTSAAHAKKATETGKRYVIAPAKEMLKKHQKMPGNVDG